MEMRTIKQLADISGVTVRALHHYDEIGLLQPSARSEAGYRLYDQSDLVRLREILVWARLGFPLAQVRELLEAGRDDLQAAIERQLLEVRDRKQELGEVEATLTRSLAALRLGHTLEESTMFEGLEGMDAPYADEAEQRWGNTDAYKESQRRTKGYDKQTWAQLGAEGDQINQAFVELLNGGVPADDAAAQEVAERHRLHIDRWFYPTSYEQHTTLAQMYVDDPRFTATYEQLAEGLAVYVRDAIVANAAARM